MLTIVAVWDAQTGRSRVVETLDSASLPAPERRKRAQEKVLELERQFPPDRYEVVLAVARSLEEFRRTDSRFLEATVETEA